MNSQKITSMVKNTVIYHQKSGIAEKYEKNVPAIKKQDELRWITVINVICSNLICENSCYWAYFLPSVCRNKKRPWNFSESIRKFECVDIEANLIKVHMLKMGKCISLVYCSPTFNILGNCLLTVPKRSLSCYANIGQSSGDKILRKLKYRAFKRISIIRCVCESTFLKIAQISQF